MRYLAYLTVRTTNLRTCVITKNTRAVCSNIGLFAFSYVHFNSTGVYIYLKYVFVTFLKTFCSLSVSCGMVVT